MICLSFFADLLHKISENIPTSSEDLSGLLLDPVLWTSLHHAEKCPWAAVEPFGWGQPNVRKAAWALVQTLLTTQKGVQFLKRLILVHGFKRTFEARRSDPGSSHPAISLGGTRFGRPNDHVATITHIFEGYFLSFFALLHCR